ncbi:dialkylrecorsinol condensing enzyme [Gilvimarinus xylanilyticus]|uniref:Dialkylresorcinol condensing enzyme n=1 Tax=Gilvimarinus xylanilyticus TaxID=2944139 RepID=A0A9X2KUR0_9GAMM|nr:dialkylrecorsinol condensing enzyme [Gilvimarinus xylanilyticus]MCP8900148.1 dialkylresorcinol condensing enzyme [Gilvimarinus xylanilyticus]
MDKVAHRSRVLVVHYSQSGQLERVARSVVAPLLADDAVSVDFLNLQPVEPYPFPWPLLRFINAFPESAHQVPCQLRVDTSHLADDYDLIILAYQVWYLSPSIPVSTFLQSELALRLLKDKPVVTVIACRNMWLQAQEKVKAHLDRLQARLVGNVALTDGVSSAASFFSTPLWVLTGRKGPHWFGLVPAAGVKEQEVAAAQRFGEKIQQAFARGRPLDETLWQGMGAVTINDKLIASEKVGNRSFYLWGKLFLACGRPNAALRQVLAVFYILFLVLMIGTVVPLTALVKTLFKPLLRKRIAEQKKYYSWPSGEG